VCLVRSTFGLLYLTHVCMHSHGLHGCWRPEATQNIPTFTWTAKVLAIFMCEFAYVNMHLGTHCRVYRHVPSHVMHTRGTCSGHIPAQGQTQSVARKKARVCHTLEAAVIMYAHRQGNIERLCTCTRAAKHASHTRKVVPSTPVSLISLRMRVHVLLKVSIRCTMMS
jgi:hypothetical protein